MADSEMNGSAPPQTATPDTMSRHGSADVSLIAGVANVTDLNPDPNPIPPANVPGMATDVAADVTAGVSLIADIANVTDIKPDPEPIAPANVPGMSSGVDVAMDVATGTSPPSAASTDSTSLTPWPSTSLADSGSDTPPSRLHTPVQAPAAIDTNVQGSRMFPSPSMVSAGLSALSVLTFFASPRRTTALESFAVDDDPLERLLERRASLLARQSAPSNPAAGATLSIAAVDPPNSASEDSPPDPEPNPLSAAPGLIVEHPQTPPDDGTASSPTLADASHESNASNAVLKIQQRAQTLTTLYYAFVNRPSIQSLRAARDEVAAILQLPEWSVSAIGHPNLMSAKVAIIEISKAIVELWSLISRQSNDRGVMYAQALNDMWMTARPVVRLLGQLADDYLGQQQSPAARPYSRAALGALNPILRAAMQSAPAGGSPLSTAIAWNPAAPGASLYPAAQSPPAPPVSYGLSVPPSVRQFASAFAASAQGVPFTPWPSPEYPASARSRTLGGPARRSSPGDPMGYLGERRRRSNFDPRVRSILVDAFASNPLPDTSYKKNIVERTGLTLTQVNDWFINERRRHNHADEKRRKRYLHPNGSPGAAA